MNEPRQWSKQLRSEVGPLRALLTKGLPQYVDDGVLDPHKLAERLGISYQAIYKIFDRNRLSSKRIAQCCLISKQTPMHMRPKGWQQLSPNDFLEFMGTTSI